MIPEFPAPHLSRLFDGRSTCPRSFHRTRIRLAAMIGRRRAGHWSRKTHWPGILSRSRMRRPWFCGTCCSDNDISIWDLRRSDIGRFRKDNRLSRSFPKPPLCAVNPNAAHQRQICKRSRANSSARLRFSDVAIALVIFTHSETRIAIIKSWLIGCRGPALVSEALARRVTWPAAFACEEQLSANPCSYQHMPSVTKLGSPSSPNTFIQPVISLPVR